MSSALFKLPRRGRKFILTSFEFSVNYFAKIFCKLFMLFGKSACNGITTYQSGFNSLISSSILS